MGKHTSIEWADHTFNPWIGCTKVSPACQHCYAETLMDTRLHKVQWGKGNPRVRTSAANWKEPLKWNREAAPGHQWRKIKELSTMDRILAGLNASHKCAKCGVFKGENSEGHPASTCSESRPRVFCASLADWLDDEVPIEWLAGLLALIHATPNLDWLLLTKRPENWKPRFAKALRFIGELGGREELHEWLLDWIVCQSIGTPPANIWIGATVENQKCADERIPELLKIPAKVRFLSCEPLLGPVEFSNVTNRADWLSQLGKRALDGIHWVIAGGESGPHARPSHPDWFRSLRDQCAEAGVPFLFKQWGEWASEIRTGTSVEMSSLADNQRVGVGDGKSNHTLYTRIGTKAAGRCLDGVEHAAFPE